jgi:hypothetical protein
MLTEAKTRPVLRDARRQYRQAELARRLNCHLPQIDRLLDLDHASRLDQLESALRAVGKHLHIDIRDAADLANHGLPVPLQVADASDGVRQGATGPRQGNKLRVAF